MKPPVRRLAFALMAATACLVLAATPAWAPQPQKPEKLVIDSIRWNSAIQAFEISHRLAFGPAVGAGAAGFELVTILHVVGVSRIGPVATPVVLRDPDDRGLRRTDGVVLLYFSLPGESVDSSLSSPVQVLVTTDLVNPGGQPVAQATAIILLPALQRGTD